MKTLNHLLENNKNWSRKVTEQRPTFFSDLAKQQNPQYVWIGCSDSRVSASNIVGLLPGEIFVHRNVANLVVHTDMNCLAVIQYAVEVLQVKHIIVCGHYGCGGVKAAMDDTNLGLIDNWLRHIQDVAQLYERTLNQIPDEEARLNRLCELNVIEQVLNVSETTIVKKAWKNGADLRVHGWIYDLSDGLLRDLKVHVENIEQMRDLRHQFWTVEN